MISESLMARTLTVLAGGRLLEAAGDRPSLGQPGRSAERGDQVREGDAGRGQRALAVAPAIRGGVRGLISVSGGETELDPVWRPGDDRGHGLTRCEGLANRHGRSD